jgi:hypothetical protein
VVDRFAGVGWAGEEHAVCVVGGDGRIVEGCRYGHDERGITALCCRLFELGVELVGTDSDRFGVIVADSDATTAPRARAREDLVEHRVAPANALGEQRLARFLARHVAVESGKSERARFGWACDHRLRNAIATMPDTRRHHNPGAAGRS